MSRLYFRALWSMLLDSGNPLYPEIRILEGHNRSVLIMLKELVKNSFRTIKCVQCRSAAGGKF